jgi:hypothetical protein
VKVESRLLIGVGLFFGVIALLYWFWSAKAWHLPDESGFLMLIGTFLLGVVPGLYYLFWHRRFEGHRVFIWGKIKNPVGPRPEDRSDAEIKDGAGVISTFPGSSIWPFVIGAGAFLVVNGLVFGWWLAIPGVTLMIMGAIGATAESRRGGHV